MRVYLDHNATSPMRPEVRALLAELASQPLGNPSSLHASGRRARHLVDEARERVAGALGVREEEVVFTSGGTESNALGVLGALGALDPGARRGLVTTAIEHSSVLETAEAAAEEGRPVVLLPVDAAGRIALGELAGAVERAGAALVSVQAANNEVGTVHPLRSIAQTLAGFPEARRPRLHVDAVQTLGKLPVAVDEWGADYASFSAHKVGGPVGVGVLVRRRGAPLRPFLRGGAQEHDVRAGTEDAIGIAAAALAIEIAVRAREGEAPRLAALGAALWREISERIPDARLAGPRPEDPDRLPNTWNVTLPGEDGRVLVTRLDLDGLEASAGSACASGSVEPSHVLRAMGRDERDARAGLRLSLGWSTTRDDCARAVDILTNRVASSRAT